MVVHFGRYVLDGPGRQLLRDGAPVHLTPKAFDLLAILVSEAPRVVDKRELHQRLWPDTFVSDTTLVGLVKEIRRALDDRNPDAPVIRTAHRVGYAFLPVVSHAPPGTAWHWLVLKGSRLALREGANVVGRDPASDVRLAHPSVSRRHARLVLSSGGTRLEDLGSKNGTTLNGEPVTEPLAVRNGDSIVFGSVAAVYRTAAPDDSTETRTPVIDLDVAG